MCIHLFQPHVHMNLMIRCLVEMESKTKFMPEFETRATVEVNGFSAECMEFDVSKQPLSVHQPLWRFLAGLFTAPPEILANYVVDESESVPRLTGDPEFRTWVTSQPLVKKNIKDYRALILEMPLRLVWVVQLKLVHQPFQGTCFIRTGQRSIVETERVLSSQPSAQLRVASLSDGDVRS